MAAINPLFFSPKLRNKLKKQGWSAIVTYSSSMIPFLMPGNKIKIKPIAFNNIEKGQIICFWHPKFKKITAHRVIKIYKKGGGIITKGDNQDFFDPLIKKNQVLGLAIKVFRNKKEINLQTKKSYILNIAARYLSLAKYHFPILKGCIKITEKFLVFFL